MITTIGSLVQETSRRWIIASGLYVMACVASALTLGAALGAVQIALKAILFCPAGQCIMHPNAVLFVSVGAYVLALVSIAYAVGDLGLLAIPHPHLMHAVPRSWWLRWRPYGAAALYGAALGLGVTTRIPFGAFYVLCGLCVWHGDLAYGALLMGTYGAARSLMLVPTSWGMYGATRAHNPSSQSLLLSQLRTSVQPAQTVVAVVLVAVGMQIACAQIW